MNTGNQLTKNWRKCIYEVYKLVINEEEAKVIRMIYDLCIGSGYGRTKIANLLASMGIRTRDGRNWPDATIGRLLHSKLYIGVLKNGDTESEIFPELQIISPENFEQAQKLLEQRAAECNYQRTMPLSTRGQSLLSGNIFCGHCGARLNLTTSGKIYTNAKGERIGKKRIRYVCYNKSRKRGDCDGQTGYTMHILDKMVTDILHEIFRKMKEADPDEIIGRTSRNATVTIEERLKAAKEECAKATAEYDSLKTEVVKVLQGRSRFSEDILSELVANACERMLDASSAVTQLNDELARETQRMKGIALDYQRVMGWADIFDKSEMPVKKMIAGYIIKRIDVYADYHLHIELNMNVEQFDLGLDFLTESEKVKINA